MDNVIIYDAIAGVLNECETVMGGVNNIQGTLDASNLISADSVVKSVQSGVIAQKDLIVPLQAGVDKDIKIISISPVNASKCFITSNIIEDVISGDNNVYYTFPFVKNDGLYLRCYSEYYSVTENIGLPRMYWSLIEFY